MELYWIDEEGRLQWVTRYTIESGKVYEMRALTLTWDERKDVLVLYMPRDKVRLKESLNQDDVYVADYA